MKNKIDVITPSYNSGDYIEECIASVIKQFPSVNKHIIIDGNSNDNTIEILKKLSEKYSHIHWISESDNGQSDALNKGLKLVKTRWFGWLNADDIYLADGLKNLLERAEEKNTPDRTSIVYGNYYKINTASEIIAKRKQPTFKYFDCLYSYLTVQNSASIFNTKIVKAAGGFDDELEFAMDYDLVLKIAKLGNVIYTDKFISGFRIHDMAKSSTLVKTMEDETLYLRNKYSNTIFPLIFLGIFSRIRIISRLLFENKIKCRLLKVTN
jgi:glycosyltransferase involved in cell wall biosynthesis